ncbi:MAG: hypothetical protein ACK4N4_03200 [Burkholderiales bacterium]
MSTGPACARTLASWTKVLIFALIAVNTTVFLRHGTAAEIIDTVAWLALLMLFELETAHPLLLQRTRTVRTVHRARLAAGIAIGVAAAGYVRDHAWLDAINLGLWICIVVLLELEVRRPPAVARHRSGFAAIALLLYGGLAVMVGAWAWRGEWFDAYDAALWLAAFVVIELNLLDRLPPAGDRELTAQTAVRKPQ